MSIPQIDWLHRARALSIGSETRIIHSHEGRPNLVIGNAKDKWWCYCHSCKEGGVVMKDHVILSNQTEPNESRSLTLPNDIVMFAQLEDYILKGLATFLLHKGMDLHMFNWNNLGYSASRKRIMLYNNESWLGRDITEKSPSKWITYNNQVFAVGYLHSNTPALVVEDPFSMVKVAWVAMRKSLNISVYSSLGTRIHDKLLVQLIKNHSEVIMMYDGDVSGTVGAAKSSAKLRGIGMPVSILPVPWGQDPKDLPVQSIMDLLSNITGGHH